MGPSRISNSHFSVLQRVAETAPLGGSWVVISRVISRITTAITYVKGQIAPLTTTHEPPSKPQAFGPPGIQKLRNFGLLEAQVGVELVQVLAGAREVFGRLGFGDLQREPKRKGNGPYGHLKALNPLLVCKPSTVKSTYLMDILGVGTWNSYEAFFNECTESFPCFVRSLRQLEGASGLNVQALSRTQSPSLDRLKRRCKSGLLRAWTTPNTLDDDNTNKDYNNHNYKKNHCCCYW